MVNNGGLGCWSFLCNLYRVGNRRGKNNLWKEVVLVKIYIDLFCYGMVLGCRCFLYMEKDLILFMIKLMFKFEVFIFVLI